MEAVHSQKKMYGSIVVTYTADASSRNNWCMETVFPTLQKHVLNEGNLLVWKKFIIPTQKVHGGQIPTYFLKHLKLEYLPSSICTSLSSLMLLKLETCMMNFYIYIPSSICTATQTFASRVTAKQSKHVLECREYPVIP